VPEYRSAKETGILQPYETPTWMAAFSDEEAPIALEEEQPAEFDLGGEDSFLAALGIETPAEPEPSLGAETALPDLDDLAGLRPDDSAEADRGLPTGEPAPEEGVMPDWLAAITSSASEQFDDLRFEDAEVYSPEAEASGLVSEGELDWLTPLGEEKGDQKLTAEDSGAPRRDITAIFDEAEESPGGAEAADFMADLDLGDLGLGQAAPAEAEDVRAWFAEAEPDEAEALDFDLDMAESQVAQPDDLAHTSKPEAEEEEFPWLADDEVPDDFSFEEVTPRWLRRLKPRRTGSPSASADEATPGASDWLRDVFEDDDLK
jgi:hypothetical protein